MQNDLKGRKFVVLPNLMHNEKVKFDVVATFFSSRKLNSFCTQALIKSRRIVMIACGCIAGILGLQSTGVRISFFLFRFFFLDSDVRETKFSTSGTILFLCNSNDYFHDANLSNEI